MEVTIKKSKAKGEIQAQPSKSYAHRLLIAAGLSHNDCVIENVVLSNDIIATLNCLNTLGKEIEIKGQNIKTIIMKNNNSFNLNNINELVFDCLESGSTLRFFIPIALLLNKKVIFKGSEKLISRGIKVYEDICLKQNISITKNNNSIIFEGSLKSDVFNIEGNISSQFISGLLFSLPLLKEDSVINITTNIESKNYIDITIDVLKQAGVLINKINDYRYEIKGNQKYTITNCVVEGDYSNSAFIDCLNYLNGDVLINGLNINSLQGDKKYVELFEKLNNGYYECDISNCIDLGPILFAFASLKHGGCFSGVKRLKIKESDRINDIKEQLEKFGVSLVEKDNKVIIDNKKIKKPIEKLYGKNDHRIVMALSVMLTCFGGTICGAEAVNKSYPSFFEDLKKLNIGIEYDK